MHTTHPSKLVPHTTHLSKLALGSVTNVHQSLKPRLTMREAANVKMVSSRFNPADIRASSQELSNNMMVVGTYYYYLVN